MENCVIIYQSRTGFTEKYARWIGEELGGESYPLCNVNLVHLDEYDLIIFGGGVRAGKIDGIRFVDKTCRQFPDKKIVIFATGAAPQNDAATVERVRSMNVPKNSGIPFFYLQSGFNYELMQGMDKIIIAIAKVMLGRVKNKDGMAREMLAAMQGSYDHSSRELIEPLISYVKSQ